MSCFLVLRNTLLLECVKCGSAPVFELLITKFHINGTRNPLSTAQSGSNVLGFVVVLFVLLSLIAMLSVGFAFKSGIVVSD